MVSRQYLRLWGTLLAQCVAGFDLAGVALASVWRVGGPVGGRSAPAPPPAAASASWPRSRAAGPSCLRASVVCGPVRSSRLSGGPSGPLCGAPAPPGSPTGAAGRPPPGLIGPLAVRVGGWSGPPAASAGPALVPVSLASGPPLGGPGLVVASAWCPGVLPPLRRAGAFAPPQGRLSRPIHLANGPDPRGVSAVLDAVPSDAPSAYLP